MSGEQKSLISNIKDYVSTYEELPNLDSNYYKLTIHQEPDPPCFCPQEPSFKAKVLRPLKTDQLIKTILLCVAEVVLLVFFILCCTKTFGTLTIMFGAPVSIGLMIFVGIKIKSNNGISYYIQAKKENEQKIRYNQKHAKEIQEALEVANSINRVALKEHEEKKVEYEKKKALCDFCKAFELKLGNSISSKKSGIAFDCGDGKERFLISLSNLKELLQYYIDHDTSNEKTQVEDLIGDISDKIIGGTKDKSLWEFITTIRKEHFSAVERIKDEQMIKRWALKKEQEAREAQEAVERAERLQREEEIKQKRKAQDARTKCYHCTHYDTCTVKGRIDCPMYSFKL